MRVLLLFLDGVGIGKSDGTINPFFKAHLPNLRSLLGGELPHSKLKRISTARAELTPVNATLGVSGLPQSGTGQTAIFTGVNASKFIGKHFGPHPTTTLRPVVEEKNIFQRLKLAHKSVCFANAFPKQFFEYTSSGTRRLTVTTLSCQFSGVPLLTGESLRKNEAISADITRTHWPKLGYPELPTVSSEEAGRHLWSITARHDFTLFEYWLTDHAGHSRDMNFSVDILERFDGLLGGLLGKFDFANSLLVLISDHGNIEDLSTKSHTRNPVPCIVVGGKRKEFSAHVQNLTHITPTILKFLEV
ncbi:MAG: metalloenzyme [Ignavibacteriales bacterium]|nr:metalloenzyme [Ignavibacteriales bacterium]